MKRLRFIANARRIWHRLWSVRLSLISSLFATAQSCLDYAIEGTPHPLIVLAALISIGSAVSRVVAQDELPHD